MLLGRDWNRATDMGDDGAPLVGRGDFHLLEVSEGAHFYGKPPERVGVPVFFAKRREQLNGKFARVLFLLPLGSQVSRVDTYHLS